MVKISKIYKLTVLNSFFNLFSILILCRMDLHFCLNNHNANLIEMYCTLYICTLVSEKFLENLLELHHLLNQYSTKLFSLYICLNKLISIPALQSNFIFF